MADLDSWGWRIIGTIVVVGGLVAAAAVAGLGPLSAADSGPEGDSNLVQTSQHSVSASVNFPTSPTNPQVILFKQEPENWGNYVDFSASDAKSGKQSGIDYLEATSVNSDNKAVFSDVDADSYYAYINADNYQPTFTQVDMPSQVDKEIYVTNDNDYKLAGADVMRTTSSIKSDNVVSYDRQGNVLATGSDLPDATSNGTQTVEFVRTIDVDTGTALLGDYTVSSFNSDDGVQTVDMTVDMGSQTYSKELKDGSSGELADGTSFGEDLVSNAETSPAEVSGTVEVTYTMEIDRNTDVSTSDDGQLGPGESIFTGALDDVFGNDFGSSASISYTG